MEEIDGVFVWSRFGSLRSGGRHYGPFVIGLRRSLARRINGFVMH